MIPAPVQRVALPLMVLVVCVALFPAALGVGSSAPSHGGGTYTVSGHVTDSFTLLPVPGARVDTNLGPWSTTNVTGAFNLTVPWAPSVVLKVTAAGFHRDNLNVGLGHNVSAVVVTLKPFMFRAQGAVVDIQSSSPVVGAHVSVTPGSESTTTSATGQYTLCLPNGTFALTVTAAGFPAFHELLWMNGTPMTKYLLLTPYSNASAPPGTSPGGSGGVPAFWSGLAGLSQSTTGVVTVILVVLAAVGLGVFAVQHRRARIRRIRAEEAGAMLFTIPAREPERGTRDGHHGSDISDSRKLRRRYRAFFRRLF